MLKLLLKKIIAWKLWFLAQLIIKKYHPKLVGVTGSVGKTSTKDAVATVLASAHSVRGSEKSYNSEFGVPLTIIGAKSGWNSPIGWLKVFLTAFKLLIKKGDYPAWLVLEVGADRPGDIKNVAKKLNFDIAIITRLPDVPVHVEFFPNAEAVAEEKLALAQAVRAEGVVILNADDERQLSVKNNLTAKVVTYGLAPEADFNASHLHLAYKEGEKKELSGLTFKLGSGGTTMPVNLPGVVGKHQAYVALAAVAAGVETGLNLLQAVEALSRLTPPPGRLRLLKGIKETIILDDTYNASPAALAAGLETVKEIEVTGDKWAVLGDMLELGDHTIEAHKEAGRQAAGAVKHLVTVGIRTKFMLEGAKEKKFNAKNIHALPDAVAAGKYLQQHLKAGDLIYLKGSQRMRLEKAVEEIMQEPQMKELLLCRQDKEWQKR